MAYALPGPPLEVEVHVRRSLIAGTTPSRRRYFALVSFYLITVPLLHDFLNGKPMKSRPQMSVLGPRFFSPRLRILFLPSPPPLTRPPSPHRKDDHCAQHPVFFYHLATMRGRTIDGVQADAKQGKTNAARAAYFVVSSCTRRILSARR